MCFVSREAETTKNLSKSPPFFNAKSPGELKECSSQEFLESRQGSARSRHTRICTAPFEKVQRVVVPSDKFGCVCSYMAGHEDAGVMTGRLGTNTQKFVRLRRGRWSTTLWTYSNGAAQIRVCLVRVDRKSPSSGTFLD